MLCSHNFVVFLMYAEYFINNIIMGLDNKNIDKTIGVSLIKIFNIACTRLMGYTCHSLHISC